MELVWGLVAPRTLVYAPVTNGAVCREKVALAGHEGTTCRQAAKSLVDLHRNLRCGFFTIMAGGRFGNSAGYRVRGSR